MSKIPDLGNKKSTDINERFKNLPAVLADYTNEFKNAETDLMIKGKSLEIANRENSSLYSQQEQQEGF